jgi:hypothetical protein
MRRATVITVIAASAIALMGPAGTAVQAHFSPASPDVFSQIKAIKARALGTDYQCVNNCTQAGYLYSLCVSKCSYPDPGQQYVPPAFSGGVHGTDYRCVSNCTSQGYQYALCQSRCSY